MDATSSMAPIIGLVNTMVISKGAYEKLAENLQKKLSQATPQASKPEFQEEMNTIDAIYKSVIQISLTNLQSQYDLGSKLVENLNQCKELTEALPLLQEFQLQIAPLQASLKQHEEEIASLEGRIVSLLPITTPLDS